MVQEEKEPENVLQRFALVELLCNPDGKRALLAARRLSEKREVFARPCSNAHGSSGNPIGKTKAIARFSGTQLFH